MRALINQRGMRIWLSVGGMGLLAVIVMALVVGGTEDEKHTVKPTSAELTITAAPQTAGDSKSKNYHAKTEPQLSISNGPEPNAPPTG